MAQGSLSLGRELQMSFSVYDYMGIPAGARKLYVTIEAARRIASSGMLCAMPGIHSLRNMKRLVTEVEPREVAAHVGASCYLRRTGTEPFVVDQN